VGCVNRSLNDVRHVSKKSEIGWTPRDFSSSSYSWRHAFRCSGAFRGKSVRIILMIVRWRMGSDGKSWSAAGTSK
jgi:hypothetical protein